MQLIESHSEYPDRVFTETDFSGLSVKDTIFEDCEFSHCNFSSAKFSGCKFTGCTFDYCNLAIVEIPQSRFYDVHFHECKLTGIDWTRGDWPVFNPDSDLRFTHSLLTHASFMGLTLHRVRMEECRLVGADFRESDLSEAIMTGCDFSESLFNQTILRKADFTNSWGFNLDVLHNIVTGATFTKWEALPLLESLGIRLVE